MHSQRLFVLAVAVCAICANATETMINFSSLSQSGGGSTSEGNAYTQQGFTFTDGGGSGFAVWGASSLNLTGGATANTSPFEAIAGSRSSLPDAGNLFTMTSIALAPYNAPQTTSS